MDSIYSELRKNQLKRAELLPLAVLSGMLLVLLWRSFVGIDWSDEPYFAAVAYRLAIGEPLFKASWDLHQVSALVTLPLVRLYLTFAGGTEGLMLFLRIAYAVLSYMTALFVYFTWKKDMNRIGAVLAALLVMFVPKAIHTPYYNTWPILFFTIAFLLMTDKCSYKIGGGGWKHYISGACMATAVLAYPLAVIAVLCFLVYWINVLCRKKESWKNALAFLCGGFTVCILFFSYLVSTSSIGNLIGNFRYLFIDPDHQQVFSLFEYLGGFGYTLGSKPGSAVIVLITALSAAISFGGRFGKYRAVLCRVLCCGMILLALLLVIRNADVALVTSNKMNLILSVFAPAVFFLNGRRMHSSLYLYFIGLCFSLATQIGSNTSINGSTGPLVLSSMATIIYVFYALECNGCGPKTRKTAAVFLSIFVTLLLAFDIIPVYGDEPIHRLTERLEEGPYRGIYTSRANADRYRELVSSVSRWIPEGGNILFIEYQPLGYLCGKRHAATPSLLPRDLSYDMFEFYYERNPEYLPDVIYRMKECEPVMSDFFKQYFQEHLKGTRETGLGTIYYFE